MFVRKSTHKLALAKAKSAQHQAERDSLGYHRRADQAEARLVRFQDREFAPAKVKPSKSEKLMLSNMNGLLRKIDDALACDESTESIAAHIANLNAYKESLSA